MGQVPGEVIAAAFAVFNPAEVVPDVARGWALTDAATIWAARQAGATAQLRRILGPDPAGMGRITELLEAAAEPLPLAGRPLFAGHLGLERPEGPLARFWLAADTLREYRGDSHTMVWTAAGFDPVEIGLLGDLYWGLPPRAHTGSRGWSAEQLAAGEERLRRRGLLDSDALTPAGAAAREDVEARTDAAVAPAEHLDGGRDRGVGAGLDVLACGSAVGRQRIAVQQAPAAEPLLAGPELRRAPAAAAGVGARR